MNKVVIKGLKLSDQGVWSSPKGVNMGVLKGKEFCRFGTEMTRYFTHLWLARKFLNNPRGWKNVEIINPKKKLTVDNVRWIKSHKNKLDHIEAKKIVAEYTKEGSTVTQGMIAKRYGVSISLISRIISGERWA
jgi:hypothetical protein